MDKSWQMCVVDRNMIDFNDYPTFNEQCVESSKKNSSIKDGDVVFVVTSALKPFSKLGPSFDELAQHGRYAFMDGVMFAYIWIPKFNRYNWIFQDFLKPILTEQDATEAELKFCTDLKDFT